MVHCSRRSRVSRVVAATVSAVMLVPGCSVTRPGAASGRFAAAEPPVAVGIGGGRPATGDRGGPNIVLVTTDDQNAGDLRWMPKTRRLLGGRGATFTQALAPHPLCCPARTEILTGQYAQNNGVQHNHGRYGGFKALESSSTIATWLQARGYATAFVGKFLNEYGSGSPRPPGWDVWNPMTTGLYDYFGTTFRAGSGLPGEYSVDTVARETSALVRLLGSGSRPFFLWSSPVAPHARLLGPQQWGPPLAAARHAATPVDVRAPSLRKPSFNRWAGPQPGVVGTVRGWRTSEIQAYFRQRVRSLRAVDDLVARLVGALRERHLLDHTYVFFTSDNGMLLGEHGVVGKNLLYDEALRIPMLVRGPGVVPGLRSRVPVALTDLAPTFLDLAGAPSRGLDGASFRTVLSGGPVRWRDTQLLLTGRATAGSFASGWGFRGVRTRRYTYGFDAGSGTVLLFDRRRDPYEVHDVAQRPAYREVRLELAARTVALSRCRGDTCDRSFGPVPDPGG